jgi:cytochrome bd-type quinol oxidase subunit 2
VDINEYFKSPFSELTGIGGLVKLFVDFAFVVAGLILFFYFIMGGIGLIASAGESDPQKAEQAKKTITSAVIGFVVVFTAYWIVKLIGNLLNIPIL